MKNSNPTKLFIKICGIFIVLNGLFVIAGWLFRNPHLIQLGTLLPPMQFNTALCFIIAGMGLFNLGNLNSLYLKISGALILALSLSISMEYLFNISVGIDTLFFTPPNDMAGIHPGRMSPNTAIDFIFTSGIFLLLSFKKEKFNSWGLILIVLLSSLIISFALVTVLEFITGISNTKALGGNILMSIHSAVCFVIMGMTIIIYAFQNAKSLTILLPIPVFFGLLTAVFYISLAVRNYEDMRFSDTVQNEVVHAASEFSQSQNNLYRALNHIAQRWMTQGGTPRAWFEADAKTYLHDYPTLQALSIADKNFNLIWIVPLENHEKFIGKPYNIEAERAKAIEEALATHSAQTTRAVTLLTDHSTGFIYIDPLYVNNVFDGLLIAGFNSTASFNYLFEKNIFQHYYLVVMDENTQIFSNVPNGVTLSVERWSQSTQTTINKRLWNFTLTPKPELLATKNSHIPYIILFSGLLISLITALAIFFGLKSKQNELALSESEERLHLATTNTSDGLWDWNLLTGEVYYSPRFMEMLGYKEYELPYNLATFNALVHPDDRASNEHEVELHTQFDKPYNTEYRLKHKDGHYIWCNSRGQASYDKDNQPVRMTGFLTNISETKEAQAQLKWNKDWLQAIMDASHHSIISVDRNGTIQLFNHAAERMLGYKAAEMVGRESPAIIHLPEEIEAYSAELTSLLGREVKPGFETFMARLSIQDADEREWTYVRKDQTTFPVWLSVTALRVNNMVVGYVGIAQDISERKVLEAMKNEFISIVSHELRTPITSIQGVLSLMLGGALGAFDVKAEKMLAIAHNNCERLIRLINDILDIEKIDAGKMEFNLLTYELNKLSEESIQANRSYAEKFSVSLNLIPYEQPLYVKVDSDRLLQVFTNLLSNAVKFSPKHGTVNMQITFKDNKAIIAFIDKGPGIPEAFQKTIFQKFSQADSTASRKQGGTGLGLNISKAIIEKLGGTIRFETKVNQGTIFIVELPASTSKE